MSARKLWKVVQPDGTVTRPESLTKAYSVHVANARAAYRGGPDRFVRVFVDERDGRGWMLLERVDISQEVPR